MVLSSVSLNTLVQAVLNLCSTSQKRETVSFASSRERESQSRCDNDAFYGRASWAYDQTDPAEQAVGGNPDERGVGPPTGFEVARKELQF